MVVGIVDLPESVILLIAQRVHCFSQRCARASMELSHGMSCPQAEGMPRRVQYGSRNRIGHESTPVWHLMLQPACCQGARRLCHL